MNKDAAVQHKSRELADSIRAHAESERVLNLQVPPFNSSSSSSGNHIYHRLHVSFSCKSKTASLPASHWAHWTSRQECAALFPHPLLFFDRNLARPQGQFFTHPNSFSSLTCVTRHPPGPLTPPPPPFPCHSLNQVRHCRLPSRQTSFRKASGKERTARHRRIVPCSQFQPRASQGPWRVRGPTLSFGVLRHEAVTCCV